MDQSSTQNRMIHFDLLRILAAFSVVMLHTSAQFWYTTPVRAPQWLIANSYNALVRFGVPIFVMISGALFLSSPSKIDIKRLYTHNISRLFNLYIVWSCIYGLASCADAGLSSLYPIEIFQKLLYSKYHLWYLPMLIGIYMLLPILKTWVENAGKQNIEYFLLLFLIFQIGKETTNALLPFAEIIHLTSLFAPYMVCGYLGYFILGYYLFHYGIDEKYHNTIYITAVISSLCNVFLSCRISLWKQEPLAEIDDSFGIFTFIVITAIFLFFTTKVSKLNFTPRAKSLIHALSLDTLGVYVMHIGLLEILEKQGVHSMMIPNAIGIPLLAIFSYLVCTAAAAILRRIPIIGKYIC